MPCACACSTNLEQKTASAGEKVQRGKMQCCRKWFIESAAAAAAPSENQPPLPSPRRAMTPLTRSDCCATSCLSFSTDETQRSRSFFRLVAASFGLASPPMGGT